jgi:hypothetical protein
MVHLGEEILEGPETDVLVKEQFDPNGTGPAPLVCS